MGMQINTNVSGLNAYRNLSITQGDLSKSLEKLSSGLRINRAGDDAAGLAISEGLKSQIGGLKVAARNAQDGISVVQTAEGSLQEVHSTLQRLRDLAVQAGNDSNNATARAAIQTESDQLVEELARISASTNFNGTNLLDGSAATLTFQVGANADPAAATAAVNTIEVSLANADVATLAADLATGGANALAYSTNAEAQASIETLDAAITTISTARSELGAYQNRFERTINNLNVAVENLSASNSRIRDTDMAAEMAQFTRSQILSQAGTAMLAQANQLPQGVLQLLR